jgi:hypothetical protein
MNFLTAKEKIDIIFINDEMLYIFWFIANEMKNKSIQD